MLTFGVSISSDGPVSRSTHAHTLTHANESTRLEKTKWSKGRQSKGAGINRKEKTKVKIA